ncbi:heavy metal translocating P-type ATPase [Psychrosphaera sp.]|nr:heavy metal translocating P-type ATPase [Psychrosphaera sp.]
MEKCFHCGSDVLNDGEPLFIKNKGQLEPVCCRGCKAISEHILGNGLSNYYEFRSELASKPTDEYNNSSYDIYADESYLGLIATQRDGVHQITLSIDNIHCAACAWLIEQALSSINGLNKISVNTISQRATLQWDNREVTLDIILKRFDSVGYPATPFKVSDVEVTLKNKEKQYIKRLGVAGLFTMQVMMLAVAMYFGAFESMESHQIGYFKWISFLLSMPVILYSAVPFLTGAISSIKAKTLNMDVPVSVAIYGAFIASLYQLIINGMDGSKGEVFFESISMFTFLLLIGKYLEFRAKSKAILSNSNLSSSLPSTVTKLVKGTQITCLVKDINVGDFVTIKAGEKIAVDGIITDGQTQVNESVLTGEFSPIPKGINDTVLAGSINSDGFITVEVSATDQDTALAEINSMQESFADFKPKYSQVADRVAHWFVLAQLVISILTYIYWAQNSPSDALWISLSVLVATCPCALSLATPTAYTCVLSTLSKSGILIKDAVAFDRLNQINTVIFDKTGTLSEGVFSITESNWNKENIPYGVNEQQILSYVYLLERDSEHPIAKAFSKEALAIENVDTVRMAAANVNVEMGKGISGLVNNLKIKIGSAEFCGVARSKANVYVVIDNKLVVSFLAEDKLRSEAQQTLATLKLMNKKLVMLTGDSSINADKLVHGLPLDHIETGCSPKFKANYIRSLQKQDNATLMVGDGINDAPVLAGSDVSLAMGGGADITKQVADVIVANNSLKAVSTLLQNAAKTRQIIKQNLYWALVYNLSILPVAMMGLVPPYIAVVGMSASSIIVVSNSLRLLK